MTTSRSTPRLRLTAAVLLTTLLLTAMSRRTLLDGPAGVFAQWLGYALVVVGALGRVWTSSFIAGRKDRELVTSGPYARCRHPLYSLQWLALLGLGLATRSVVLTLLMAVLFALVFRRAARSEDALLASLHGERYREYAAITPAFLPRAARKPVPDEIAVRPAVFAKAFLDAASLLGLYALLQAADLLQRTGQLPALLQLP